MCNRPWPSFWATVGSNTRGTVGDNVVYEALSFLASAGHLACMGHRHTQVHTHAHAHTRKHAHTKRHTYTHVHKHTQHTLTVHEEGLPAKGTPKWAGHWGERHRAPSRPTTHHSCSITWSLHETCVSDACSILIAMALAWRIISKANFALWGV